MLLRAPPFRAQVRYDPRLARHYLWAQTPTAIFLAVHVPNGALGLLRAQLLSFLSSPRSLDPPPAQLTEPLPALSFSFSRACLMASRTSHSAHACPACSRGPACTCLLSPAGSPGKPIQVEVGGQGELRVGAGPLPVVHRRLAGPLEPGVPLEVSR